ncbi:MAG: putative phage associated protein, partial [Thermoleophilia bacterium]|nr:putative phage associated protein [Thermoleophilia bacterium]
WAKHGIHRKGTPGFSQDARRAYVQNMFHGARYLAKLRYADQLQDKLTDMQAHVEAQAGNEAFDSVKGQQIVDEMNKRNDSLMNPKSNPLSTALTSFGFVFHLGLSPASAMVNLSQTALVAYPIMGAKWGFDKAAAAMAVAGKQAATNKNDISSSLTPDERRAYDAAVNAGTIDVTNAHDLAGIAQGEDSGIMWKVRPIMKWASFLFHHAERFNRQITFVASYRLARAAGTAHDAAFEQATKATYDGHFDYAASNRPRVMQGNVAKVLLLFKQFAQNSIYLLVRQAQLSINAEKPADRREARRALGSLLTMHAAAAGVLGLPLVTTLLAAASMLGGSDDEPWDAEDALRNTLAETFGQKPAEVMARGFSRLTPWDISSRVGLDKLIFPDVQEGLSGQRWAESAMASALGPVAGIGVNMLKGMQDIAGGNYARGLESMMPAALRGPIKALRYEQEGNVDKSGVVINDEVSAAGVLGQAIGFSPSETRNATEGRSAVFSADKRLGERRAELMGQFAKAYMQKDDAAVAEARAEIAQFNEVNPSRRINPIQMMQSVKGRKKRIDEAKDGVYLPKNRQDAMSAGSFAKAD